MEAERSQTRAHETAERTRETSERHETTLPFASEGLESLRDSHC